MLSLPLICVKDKNNLSFPFTNIYFSKNLILNNVFLININTFSYVVRYLFNKKIFNFYIFDFCINIFCKLNHNLILLNNLKNSNQNIFNFNLILITLYQIYLMDDDKNNSKIKLLDFIYFNIIN